MPELQIIGVPQSNYVWVVRIACHEKGVPYTLLPVMPHTPEIEAIHPLGKIPALRHGDVVLAESRGSAVISITHSTGCPSLRGFRSRAH
jgi:glutathione S-transferase